MNVLYSINTVYRFKMAVNVFYRYYFYLFYTFAQKVNKLKFKIQNAVPQWI